MSDEVDTGARGASPAPPQLPPPPPVYPRQPKSPGLAALLSLLFPGVGQIYNGQLAKAIVVFMLFVSAVYATAMVDPMPFAFLIPFTFLFNLVDAYRSADAINLRHAGGEPVEEDTGVESPAWGGGLVLLGVVLLMHNFGWLPLQSLRRLWPVALIVAGGVLLWGSFRKASVGDDPDRAGEA
jgi:hypothetical protein